MTDKAISKPTHLIDFGVESLVELIKIRRESTPTRALKTRTSDAPLRPTPDARSASG
jgi:hypothetical protein